MALLVLGGAVTLSSGEVQAWLCMAMLRLQVCPAHTALPAPLNRILPPFHCLLRVQGANVAEDVRNEYNWRVRDLVSPVDLVGMRLPTATLGCATSFVRGLPCTNTLR